MKKVSRATFQIESSELSKDADGEEINQIWETELSVH